MPVWPPDLRSGNGAGLSASSVRGHSHQPRAADRGWSAPRAPDALIGGRQRHGDQRGGAVDVDGALSGPAAPEDEESVGGIGPNDQVAVEGIGAGELRRAVAIDRAEEVVGEGVVTDQIPAVQDRFTA